MTTPTFVSLLTLLSVMYLGFKLWQYYSKPAKQSKQILDAIDSREFQLSDSVRADLTDILEAISLRFKKVKLGDMEVKMMYCGESAHFEFVNGKYKLTKIRELKDIVIKNRHNGVMERLEVFATIQLHLVNTVIDLQLQFPSSDLVLFNLAESSMFDKRIRGYEKPLFLKEFHEALADC